MHCIWSIRRGARTLRDRCKRRLRRRPQAHQHLNGQDGIEALYRRPNTSRAHPAHPGIRIATGLSIQRPIRPGARHHVHPDGSRLRVSGRRDGLASRKVLAWRLSITMDVDSRRRDGGRDRPLRRPEIVNTDQAAVTSRSHGSLKAHEIRISMDGRGRCLDNGHRAAVGSVKYESVLESLRQRLRGTRIA